MLIDCSLMGPERQFELPVPDIRRAAFFYRSAMDAAELFRLGPAGGAPVRLGLAIGMVGLTLVRAGDVQDGWTRPTLTLLAATLGTDFVALLIPVADPAAAARRVIEQGGSHHPQRCRGTIHLLRPSCPSGRRSVRRELGLHPALV